jgi:hypothetical protein
MSRTRRVMGAAEALSSSVCVDASLYTGFGLGAVRPFVFVELPDVLRATPWLCSRWRADGEGSGWPRRFCVVVLVSYSEAREKRRTVDDRPGVLSEDPALFLLPFLPL